MGGRRGWGAKGELQQQIWANDDDWKRKTETRQPTCNAGGVDPTGDAQCSYHRDSEDVWAGERSERDILVNSVVDRPFQSMPKLEFNRGKTDLAGDAQCNHTQE